MKTKNNEKRDKYWDFELKNLGNMKVAVILIVTGTLGTIAKGLVGCCKVKTRRVNREHPNQRMFEIGENTVKSPGDLRRFAFTQTPMKDHRWCKKSYGVKKKKYHDLARELKELWYLKVTVIQIVIGVLPTVTKK